MFDENQYFNKEFQLITNIKDNIYNKYHKLTLSQSNSNSSKTRDSWEALMFESRQKSSPEKHESFNIADST